MLDLERDGVEVLGVEVRAGADILTRLGVDVLVLVGVDVLVLLGAEVLTRVLEEFALVRCLVEVSVLALEFEFDLACVETLRPNSEFRLIVEFLLDILPRRVAL